MKIWIDQGFCTGDGLCEEIFPARVQVRDHGLAYVCENGAAPPNPSRSGSRVVIVVGNEDAVLEAAFERPGECIFIDED
ncbi:MAG: ferredoxin [Actinomycetota bacterium]|nr:ferredoxin [Actinomycetota bacterium]